MGNKGETATRM